MAHWRNDDVDCSHVRRTRSNLGWAEGRAQLARCLDSERHNPPPTSGAATGW
jgi:hypothetical protein